MAQDPNLPADPTNFAAKPIAPPAVLGQSYTNLKTYLGITSIPQFNLSPLLTPVMDLTKISSQNEIQRATQAITWGAGVVSSCRSDESIAVGLACPVGFEHIYLQFAIDACDLAAFKLRVYSQTTQVYQNDTASTRHYLDRTVLPIYVGPGESLYLYSDQAGAAANVAYLRLQRVNGLGPLAI